MNSPTNIGVFTVGGSVNVERLAFPPGKKGRGRVLAGGLSLAIGRVEYHLITKRAVYRCREVSPQASFPVGAMLTWRSRQEVGYV